MRRAVSWLLLCLGARPLVAADPDILIRIHEHMREYLARLPDYTCRVTIERSDRRSPRAPFSLQDRLRLEIAYAGGREYYAWPGDPRFESTIDELLPRSGMISEGSFALHMRKLFLTSDAEFAAPREEEGKIRLDFAVPASRSGFAIGTGGASAPAALAGSVWFVPDSLDVSRLEVRVEKTSRAVRIAGTREVTSYGAVTVGDVTAVLPVESELVLRDRDGSERRNRSVFQDCRRYAGSASVHYDAAETPTEVKLDGAIPAEVAVGDVFAAAGSQVRVTDLRRDGKRWSIEFTLVGTRSVARRTISLPAPAGLTLTF